MKSSWLILFVVFGVATLAAQTPAPSAAALSVHVVTYLDLLPAQAEPGRLLLVHEVQAERAQPGCLSAELLQEDGRLNHFMIVESWREVTALDGYHAAREYLQFRATLQPSLASPFDERRGRELVP